MGRRRRSPPLAPTSSADQLVDDQVADVAGAELVKLASMPGPPAGWLTAGIPRAR
jgi:hypothetical protein